MNWAETIVALGIGGVVGAAAGVVLAVGRLSESFPTFAQELKRELEGRADVPATRLREAFARVERDAGALVEAVARLRRALRWR